MPTIEAFNISTRIKEFDKLCTSDELSLTGLQEKVNLLDESDIKHISCIGSSIHKACMNKNITLKIIEYLLDVFPRAVSNGKATMNFSTDSEVEEDEVIIVAYLLHCACYNKYCPDSIIKLLLERYPPALEQLCIVKKGINDSWYEDVSGLPLHYYLSRNENVNIDIVKSLIEAYPTSLTISDEENACLPLHALFHNESTDNLQEIITYLIELEPSSIRMLDRYGYTPLHLACMNSNMNLEIFQFLYNLYPEAIRRPGVSYGCLPIHNLCSNRRISDTNSIAILRFILDIDNAFAREGDGSRLPIDHAAMNKSKDFCKVLVDAYPESVRDLEITGSLPFHMACRLNNDVDTIQYLLDLYPESINARERGGYLPIHCAATHGNTKAVQFLLEKDPDAASNVTENSKCQLPLHLVCQHRDNGYLDTVKVLYDAYPEAIHVLDGDINTPATPLDHAMRKSKTSSNSSIVNFLQDQQRYIGGSDNDIQHLASRTELDDNDLTLLHRALQDKAPLGTIKLVIKGNPASVRVVDNQFAFPLHIACEFSSVKVVRYLEGKSNKHILGHLDENKDSVLHYACRGGNCEVVKYLLTNHSSLVASAETNQKGKLPLHLLCEARKDKVDVDSAEYVETIWLMLLSNPEAVVGG